MLLGVDANVSSAPLPHTSQPVPTGLPVFGSPQESGQPYAPQQSAPRSSDGCGSVQRGLARSLRLCGFAALAIASLLGCRQKPTVGETGGSNAPSVASATLGISSGAPGSASGSSTPRVATTPRNAPSDKSEAAAASAQPMPAATVLVTLPITAYHAKVYLDDKVTYLLTVNAAYRVAENGKLSEFRLALDSTGVLTASSILFWSKDALWEVARSGSAPRRLAKVPRQPQYMLASGHDFAWIDRNDEGMYTAQTLEKQKPHLLHSFKGMLDAALLYNGWVFFVERNADSSWRFGGLPLTGGTPAFTANKSGRSPSMLAAAGDLYYYDGTTRNILALSPDFQHEEVLAKDFICSPLAVADRIYCAQLGGLFELNKQPNSTPKQIYQTKRSITAIAADSHRVVWVNDVGQDRLELNQLTVDGTSR